MKSVINLVNTAKKMVCTPTYP